MKEYFPYMTSSPESQFGVIKNYMFLSGKYSTLLPLGTDNETTIIDSLSLPRESSFQYFPSICRLRICNVDTAEDFQMDFTALLFNISGPVMQV